MSQPTQPPYAPGPQQPYPPAGPPYGYAPPTPAKPKTRKDFWLRGPGIMILIVAFGVLILGPIAAFSALSDKEAADAIDVKMSYCSIDDAGLSSARVGLEVTNNGDSARSVVVGLEYRDSQGRRLDTDTARVGSVPAGDTVAHEETTLLNAPAGGSGQCYITSVR